MKRRKRLDIPEFYPGSILRVDYADPHATNGKSMQPSPLNELSVFMIILHAYMALCVIFLR